MDRLCCKSPKVNEKCLHLRACSQPQTDDRPFTIRTGHQRQSDSIKKTTECLKRVAAKTKRDNARQCRNIASKKEQMSGKCELSVCPVSGTLELSRVDNPPSCRSKDILPSCRTKDNPLPCRKKENPPILCLSKNKPSACRSPETPRPCRKTETPILMPCRNIETTPLCRNKDNPQPCRNNENPPQCRSKETPAPCRNKETAAPCPNKDNHLPCRNKENPLPCRNKENPLPCRNKENPLPCRSKCNPPTCPIKENPPQCRNKDLSIPCRNKEAPVPCRPKNKWLAQTPNGELTTSPILVLPKGNKCESKSDREQGPPCTTAACTISMCPCCRDVECKLNGSGEVMKLTYKDKVSCPTLNKCPNKDNKTDSKILRCSTSPMTHFTVPSDCSGPKGPFFLCGAPKRANCPNPKLQCMNTSKAKYMKGTARSSKTTLVPSACNLKKKNCQNQIKSFCPTFPTSDISHSQHDEHSLNNNKPNINNRTSLDQPTLALTTKSQARSASVSSSAFPHRDFSHFSFDGSDTKLAVEDMGTRRPNSPDRERTHNNRRSMSRERASRRSIRKPDRSISRSPSMHLRVSTTGVGRSPQLEKIEYYNNATTHRAQPIPTNHVTKLPRASLINQRASFIDRQKYTDGIPPRQSVRYEHQELGAERHSVPGTFARQSVRASTAMARYRRTSQNNWVNNSSPLDGMAPRRNSVKRYISTEEGRQVRECEINCIRDALLTYPSKHVKDIQRECELNCQRVNCWPSSGQEKCDLKDTSCVSKVPTMAQTPICGPKEEEMKLLKKYYEKKRRSFYWHQFFGSTFRALFTLIQVLLGGSVVFFMLCFLQDVNHYFQSAVVFSIIIVMYLLLCHPFSNFP